MREDNLSGQELGRYRLLRLLGCGRFSAVYLAEHLNSTLPVAVKVLQGDFSDNALEKFVTQACILIHLQHAHIVSTFDFGMIGRTPFLVMSYAPNGTLRQRYPRGTCLSLKTIVTYTQQIAGALQYIHDQKLIHRDVKPHNMFLGPGNQVLLGDFGIAIPSQTIDALHFELQDFEGTILYAAPEQLQGRPHRNSDQYALAVVVYEWLSGAWPFSGSVEEIAHQHMFVPPPSLTEKGVRVSSAVEEVMLKALAKDPYERFKSVQEFAAHLDSASQLEPPSVRAAALEPQPQQKRQFISPFPFDAATPEPEDPPVFGTFKAGV